MLQRQNVCGVRRLFTFTSIQSGNSCVNRYTYISEPIALLGNLYVPHSNVDILKGQSEPGRSGLIFGFVKIGRIVIDGERKGVVVRRVSSSIRRPATVEQVIDGIFDLIFELLVLLRIHVLETTDRSTAKQGTHQCTNEVVQSRSSRVGNSLRMRCKH